MRAFARASRVFRTSAAPLQLKPIFYKDPCTNARTLGVNVHARVSPRAHTFKPRARLCVQGSSQKIW